MKIFNLIYTLINLALASAFAFVAFMFAYPCLRPVVIIMYLIFVIVRLKISPAHFYIAWKFLSRVSLYIYQKLKGESRTDLLINSLLTVSAILILITGIMFFQKPKNIIISAADATVKQYLDAIPKSYINGKINTENDPVQIPVTTPNPIVYTAGNAQYYIYPLAVYEIAGVVRSKKDNNSLFWTTPLGYIDIGLAWGKLAKSDQYNRLMLTAFTHSSDNELRLAEDELQRNFSINHIIPSNNEIREAVKNLNINDKVILRGYLVEVKYSGWTRSWKSSLRKDIYEVFYVTDILKEI